MFLLWMLWQLIKGVITFFCFIGPLCLLSNTGNILYLSIYIVSIPLGNKIFNSITDNSYNNDFNIFDIFNDK